MITAGDIEFQQPQPKLFQLGESSMSMIYGDAAVQASVSTAAQARIVSGAVTSVAEIADIYANEYAAHRRASAEATYLRPIGLDITSFLTTQSTMNHDLVASLTSQLQNHALDKYGGAIIAGTDALGAHLYVIRDPGKSICMDSIGFAAGGGGQWHAESQVMFAGYAKTFAFDRALFLVYSAKKRAEVAPGVGAETDMVFITTFPRRIFHFTSDQAPVKQLDRIYQEGIRSERVRRKRLDKKVQLYVQTVLEAPPPPPPLPASVASDQSSSPTISSSDRT
jgi:hypothetical protein